jgi:serine/threonine protein kinase
MLSQRMTDPLNSMSSPLRYDAPDLTYRKGEVIGGRYVVLGILGEGGYGLVYHVRNRDDGREVALKTFRDTYMFDPRVRLRFRSEALTWIAIGQHSFVLQAEAVHEFDSRLFVAMEYIRPDENGLVTLYDHIAFHGRNLNDRIIGVWSIEFCHGMKHAYGKGVKAHRDVKPQNILVGDGAFIKVSDFGLATSLEEAELPGAQLQSLGLSGFHAQGRTMCGTLGYVAPEIFAGGTASECSDIYSFGVVLWQLCTGSTRPPFWEALGRSPDPAAIYATLAGSRIPPAQSPYWEVIKRCLQPQAKDRYQDFEEIKDAIKEAMRESGDEPLDFVVNTAPSFADLVNRGASLRTLGRLDEALASYEAAIALQPTIAAVWVNKGNVLSSMKRHADALAAYDRAAQIDPTFQLAWFNKGLELQHSENHPQSIRCFDKVLELNPRHSTAWRRKGKSLVAQRRFQDAQACYQNALEIDPADDLACSYLGELSSLLGNMTAARGWYDHAIRANPKCTSAWTGKADVLIELSRFDDALRCLDAALMLDPQDWASMNMKAVALCRAGRQREAIPIFDMLLKTEATELDVVWTNKGNALAELGNLEEALTCYERAILENPNYASAQRQREWVAKQLQARSGRR